MDCVSREEIKEMAEEYKIEWFECSAKTGNNVSDSFQFLAEEITKRYEFEIESIRNLAITEDMKKKTKKSKCC